MGQLIRSLLSPSLPVDDSARTRSSIRSHCSANGSPECD
jgi:hypothetical protein